MKLIRYRYSNMPTQYGWVFNNLVGQVEGDIFKEFRRLEAQVPLEKVKLETPVTPGKIICVEHNYLNPTGGEEDTTQPTFYLKSPSTVVGTQTNMVRPHECREFRVDAHLAIVIGKTGRNIKQDEVSQYIFGYTVALEGTAVDLIGLDGSMFQARGYDTTLKLGPWIETELDVAELLVNCRVKGELRQMASTREMRIPVSRLVVYLSTIMTLNPGDVILTGSPESKGSKLVDENDLIEASVEGIGEISCMLITDSEVRKPDR